MSKRTTCAPVAAWEIRVEPSGQISFAMAGVQPDYKAQHTISRGVAADDTWHHVVMTRSGRKFALHIDGKPDVSEEAEFVFDINTRAPVRLGSGVCAGQAGQTHFRGQLDEIRIYNRALNGEEIEALFRAEKSR